jgi:hypothetical protein
MWFVAICLADSSLIAACSSMSAKIYINKNFEPSLPSCQLHLPAMKEDTSKISGCTTTDMLLPRLANKKYI